MATDAKQKTTNLSPFGRVSFPAVFKPVHPNNDQSKDPIYEITLLFPPETDLSGLQAALNQKAKDHFGDKLKKLKLKNPIRDCSEKSDLDGYQEGWKFVRFWSKQRPQIRDRDMSVIDDPTEFYAGCWARVSYGTFGYTNSGNSGVSFSLNNIQKLKDDEPFGGRTNAEDDFDALEEEAATTGPTDAANDEAMPWA